MRNSLIFLTIDIVIFIENHTTNSILLIKLKNEPFKDFWALPGGFVDENEDLEVTSIRELKEETQINIKSLQQLKAFGKPYRDPRSHVVSIAFMGIVSTDTIATASDDAKEAKWISVNDLPKLAFDHDEIINFAITKIKQNEISH